MKQRRAIRVAAVLVLTTICLSCGQTYRPVANPIIPPPPDPSGFHFALVVSANAPNNPGAVTRIDVSGDTNVGVSKVGLGPVHAALTPNAGRVYVANSSEDTVSTYTPANFTAVTTVSFPAGSIPIFLTTTQTDTIYSANFGNATVSAISTATNVITNTIPVGLNPVSLAETPNGAKLYVANQGGNSVTAINTVDKSVAKTITDASIVAPVWVATRSDSARAYALSSGNGTVSAIDTGTDALLCGNTPLPACPSVGAGANFILFDKTLNRLYVTNPNAHTLNVLDASVDPPAFLATIDLTAGANPPCPAACSPVSVTALPDGSRAYVVSYQITPTCSDSADTPPCVAPRLTIINTSDNSISKTIPVDIIITVPGQPTIIKPDTPQLPQCDTARFRLFAAAAADSTRVYVSYCDAGTTAIIRTSANTDPQDPQPADTIVLDLPSPVSAYPPPPPPPPPAPVPQPPPQNPVFVLAGP